jgi:hypothetical protein
VHVPLVPRTPSQKRSSVLLLQVRAKAAEQRPKNDLPRGRVPPNARRSLQPRGAKPISAPPPSFAVLIPLSPLLMIFPCARLTSHYLGLDQTLFDANVRRLPIYTLNPPAHDVSWKVCAPGAMSDSRHPPSSLA